MPHANVTARTANVLMAKEKYTLMKYVEAEYTKAGKADHVFATQATEALGFRVVLANIATARQALDIPAAFKARGAPAADKRAAEQKMLVDGIASLESRVADLEKKFSSWTLQLTDTTKNVQAIVGGRTMISSSMQRN